MFDHHRKSPWFAEKYDPAPEFVNLRTKTRKLGWKSRESTFLHDLEAGKFDPDFNEPTIIAEPTSPIKEEANGDGETNGHSIIARTTDDTKVGVGDDETFQMDAEEEGGDVDASRVEANGKSSYKTERNGGVRGEEVSVVPEGNQVMIRTIPPDIGRVKLEEV